MEEINPRKVPLKGLPDFTSMSDDRLRESADVVQNLIFAYKSFDKEVVRVLEKVHKQMSDNLTDRLAYDMINAPVEAKKVFKKPLKIKLVKNI